MFEVKVTVELPGIPDALNHLARAIAESGASAVVKSLVPAETNEAKPLPGNNAKQTPAPAEIPVPAPVVPAPVVPAPVVPAPVVPAPAAQQTAAPAPVPAPAAEVAITMNDLSKAGAALVEMGKMDAVINLLKQFGAVAITQLREDQYASFAASLRGLGANI